MKHSPLTTLSFLLLSLSSCSISLFPEVSMPNYYTLLPGEEAKALSCNNPHSIFISRILVKSPFNGSRMYSGQDDGTLSSISGNLWAAPLTILIREELASLFTKANSNYKQTVFVSTASIAPANYSLSISNIEVKTQISQGMPEEEVAIAKAQLVFEGRTPNLKDSHRTLEVENPVNGGSEKAKFLQEALRQLLEEVVTISEAVACDNLE